MRRSRRSIKKPWLERNGIKISFLIVGLGLIYLFLFYPYIKVADGHISLVASFSFRKNILDNKPELKDVSVKWKWPNELIYSLHYRNAVASACFPGCLLIDENGIIFKLGEVEPRIYLPGYQPTIGHKIPWAPDIFILLAHAGFTDITTGEFLEARHRDGWRVYLDWENVDHQIKKLGLVWSELGLDGSAVDYLDLRYRNVFLKRK